jgi:hypothetical protein
LAGYRQACEVESREGVMPTAKGHGKYIETPEKLWGLFQEFMTWVENNPYIKQDWVGAGAFPVERIQQRPLTFVGFEKWLALNNVVSDLSSYERNENDSYADYLPILTRIRKICNGDIVEGSAANVFNASIAARVAGLVDKREVEQKEPRVFNIK